jgi:hypothetical protein
VAQALLTEISDDIGMVVTSASSGVAAVAYRPGLSCRLLTIRPFRRRLCPAEVQLRLFQRVAVFLQRDVAVIVALAALDQQVLDLAFSALTDCSLVCQVVRTLSRSDCETFCMVLRR